LSVRVRYVAMLIAMGLGWGSTQPLGKIAVSTGHQQFGLIFWQLVIGALLLGGVSLVRGKAIPLTKATLSFAVVIAFIGTIIPNSTFYYSVAHLPSGIMSILISTVPLMAFPVALMLGMDRFSVGRMAGLFCGLMGVALIALPEASLPSRAMVAFLPVAMLGPLFYAFEGNYVARFGTAGMDAVQAMFLASVVGAVIMLPVVVGSGQWIDPTAAWGRAEVALVVASIVHTLCYCSYVWLAGRAGAVFAAQTSYIVTGTGVIWAMLLLGERFSPWVWAALAIMFLGLFLVQPRAAAAKVA
jgi:drug/metabolite transporter (DMT)-like permease